MSPAGSIDESSPESRLTLRPVVTKTFIKGAIAIGVFSIFLEIPGHLLNYLIFLALAFGFVALFSFIKHKAIYSIGEENITIKRFMGKPSSINYTDIHDMSVSQGMLAKKFDCGSVYMILKKGRGTVSIMGGGTAEKLDDIPNPNYVFDLISSRLSPFSEPPS